MKKFLIMDFKKLLNSFQNAFRGIKSAFGEQTFRILCFCAVLVVIFIFIFGLPVLEIIILIFLITFVLSLELINTQIEKILNFLQPNYDPQVKIIKDISAGAVLLACLGAIIIGFFIFWPYLKIVFF